jgi:hypothetical protein
MDDVANSYLTKNQDNVDVRITLTDNDQASRTIKVKVSHQQAALYRALSDKINIVPASTATTSLLDSILNFSLLLSSDDLYNSALSEFQADSDHATDQEFLASLVFDILEESGIHAHSSRSIYF